MPPAPNKITPSSSVVYIDSTQFTGPIVIELGSLKTFGTLITIRDIGGELSVTKPLILSTTEGVFFRDGTSSFLLTYPYDGATVQPISSNLYDTLNIASFPIAAPYANLSSIDALIYTANSILPSTLQIDSISRIGALNSYTSTFFTGPLLLNQGLSVSHPIEVESIGANNISTTVLTTFTAESSRLRIYGRAIVSSLDILDNSLTVAGSADFTNGLLYTSSLTTTSNNPSHLSVDSYSTIQLSSAYIQANAVYTSTTSASFSAQHTTAQNSYVSSLQTNSLAITDSLSTASIQANTTLFDTLTLSTFSTSQPIASQVQTGSFSTANLLASSIYIYDNTLATAYPIWIKQGLLYFKDGYMLIEGKQYESLPSTLDGYGTTGYISSTRLNTVGISTKMAFTNSLSTSVAFVDRFQYTAPQAFTTIADAILNTASLSSITTSANQAFQGTTVLPSNIVSADSANILFISTGNLTGSLTTGNLLIQQFSTESVLVPVLLVGNQVNTTNLMSQSLLNVSIGNITTLATDSAQISSFQPFLLQTDSIQTLATRVTTLQKESQRITTNLFASTARMNQTLLTDVPLYTSNTRFFISNSTQELITNSVLTSQIRSTVAGLGTSGYLSSANIAPYGFSTQSGYFSTVQASNGSSATTVLESLTATSSVTSEVLLVTSAANSPSTSISSATVLSSLSIQTPLTTFTTVATSLSTASLFASSLASGNAVHDSILVASSTSATSIQYSNVSTSYVSTTSAFITSLTSAILLQSQELTAQNATINTTTNTSTTTVSVSLYTPSAYTTNATKTQSIFSRLYKAIFGEGKQSAVTATTAMSISTNILQTTILSVQEAQVSSIGASSFTLNQTILTISSGLYANSNTLFYSQDSITSEVKSTVEGLGNTYVSSPTFDNYISANASLVSTQTGFTDLVSSTQAYSRILFADSLTTPILHANSAIVSSLTTSTLTITSSTTTINLSSDSLTQAKTVFITSLLNTNTISTNTLNTRTLYYTSSPSIELSTPPKQGIATQSVQTVSTFLQSGFVDTCIINSDISTGTIIATTTSTVTLNALYTGTQYTSNISSIGTTTTSTVLFTTDILTMPSLQTLSLSTVNASIRTENLFGRSTTIDSLNTNSIQTTSIVTSTLQLAPTDILTVQNRFLFVNQDVALYPSTITSVTTSTTRGLGTFGYLSTSKPNNIITQRATANAVLANSTTVANVVASTVQTSNIVSEFASFNTLFTPILNTNTYSVSSIQTNSMTTTTSSATSLGSTETPLTSVQDAIVENTTSGSLLSSKLVIATQGVIDIFSTNSFTTQQFVSPTVFTSSLTTSGNINSLYILQTNVSSLQTSFLSSVLLNTSTLSAITVQASTTNVNRVATHSLESASFDISTFEPKSLYANTIETQLLTGTSLLPTSLYTSTLNANTLVGHSLSTIQPLVDNTQISLLLSQDIQISSSINATDSLTANTVIVPFITSTQTATISQASLSTLTTTGDAVNVSLVSMNQYSGFVNAKNTTINSIATTSLASTFANTVLSSSSLNCSLLTVDSMSTNSISLATSQASIAANLAVHRLLETSSLLVNTSFALSTFNAQSLESQAIGSLIAEFDSFSTNYISLSQFQPESLFIISTTTTIVSTASIESVYTSDSFGSLIHVSSLLTSGAASVSSLFTTTLSTETLLVPDARIGGEGGLSTQTVSTNLLTVGKDLNTLSITADYASISSFVIQSSLQTNVFQIPSFMKPLYTTDTLIITGTASTAVLQTNMTMSANAVSTVSTVGSTLNVTNTLNTSQLTATTTSSMDTQVLGALSTQTLSALSLTTSLAQVSTVSSIVLETNVVRVSNLLQTTSFSTGQFTTQTIVSPSVSSVNISTAILIKTLEISIQSSQNVQSANATIGLVLASTLGSTSTVLSQTSSLQTNTISTNIVQSQTNLQTTYEYVSSLQASTANIMTGRLSVQNNTLIVNGQPLALPDSISSVTISTSILASQLITASFAPIRGTTSTASLTLPATNTISTLQLQGPLVLNNTPYIGTNTSTPLYLFGSDSTNNSINSIQTLTANGIGSPVGNGASIRTNAGVYTGSRWFVTGSTVIQTASSQDGTSWSTVLGANTVVSTFTVSTANIYSVWAGVYRLGESNRASIDGSNFSSIPGQEIITIAHNDDYSLFVGQDFGGTYFSRDLINWSTTTGAFVGSPYSLYNGIAYGSNRNNSTLWVQVGRDNSNASTMQYSFNGSNWLTCSAPRFTFEAKGVATGNGYWVAGGTDTNGLSNWGNLKTSSDGISWTNYSTASFYFSPWSVAYGNGVFVATGSNINGGTPTVPTPAYYSIDNGSNWTQVSLSTMALSPLGIVKYLNNRFVAIETYTGSATDRIHVSLDGKAFSTFYLSTNICAANVKDITFDSNRGLYYVCSEAAGSFSNTFIMYSADLVNWSNILSGNLTYTFNKSVNCLLTLPTYTVLQSTLGSGFTTQGNAIAYGPPYIVAVGQDSTQTNTIQFSQNGTTWQRPSSGGFTQAGNDIAWNGRQWVAVGASASSNDTIQTTTTLPPTSWTSATTNGFTGQGKGVTWNGSLWIAVGQDANSNATIKVSKDGLTWSNTKGSGFTVQGNAVAWNGTTCVAVGQDATTPGTIKYSSDGGITWSNSYGPGFLSGGTSVLYDGTQWIATGIDGGSYTIQVSQDGITWTPVSQLPATMTPRGLALQTQPSGTLGLKTLAFHGTGIEQFTLSTNQITALQSSLVLNATLKMDLNSKAVGIRSAQPGATGNLKVQGNLKTDFLAVPNLVYSTLITANSPTTAIQITSGQLVVSSNAQTTIQIPCITSPLTLSTPSILLSTTQRFNAGCIDVWSGQYPPPSSVSTSIINAFQNTLAFSGTLFVDQRNNRVGICQSTISTATLEVNGSIAKTTGSFTICHPDPSKANSYKLRHCFVESPTRGDTLYTWVLSTIQSTCLFHLPSYFNHLNESPQAWVTAIDSLNADARATVCLSTNTLLLESTEDGLFQVLCIATRKDDGAREFDRNYGDGVEYIR
jgi:hypothetical protein